MSVQDIDRNLGNAKERLEGTAFTAEKQEFNRQVIFYGLANLLAALETANTKRFGERQQAIATGLSSIQETSAAAHASIIAALGGHEADPDSSLRLMQQRSEQVRAIQEAGEPLPGNAEVLNNNMPKIMEHIGALLELIPETRSAAVQVGLGLTSIQSASAEAATIIDRRLMS